MEVTNISGAGGSDSALGSLSPKDEVDDGRNQGLLSSGSVISSGCDAAMDTCEW